MFLPSTKSKTQKLFSVVQTISHIKNAATSGGFKRSNTPFKLQVAQPSSQMFRFGKSSSIKVYQSLVVILLASLFFISCQKEELTDPVLNNTTSNDAVSSATTTAPSVDAGRLQRVVYSSTSRSTTISATLYGTASSSTGAVTVKWKQIRGNSTATIAQPTNDTTKVSGLVPGVYTFTLTATDKNGVSRIDSTHVTVLKKMNWTIEGVTREALVHPPTGATAASAVIFAFHGHGGTDLGWAERAFEVQWPEAIVVYPQGLPTKSGSDKAGTESGWQHSVGEVNTATGITDQDIKFYDAMISTLKNTYNVNSRLIFAHGWSNGGDFIYNVLWVARSKQFAAIAPAAAILKTSSGKRPMPIIHIAGTSDPQVSFNSQVNTVQADRTLDQCSSKGTTWATGPNKMLGTQYNSSTYPPGVVLLQYDGGHAYPFTIPPYIVKFFKQVAGVK